MAEESAEIPTSKVNSSILGGVAESIGLDAGSLLFLLTIFSCYPLSYIARTFLHGQPPTVKHVYFTVGGLSLLLINFGSGSVHSFISILVNYAVLVAVGGSQLSVALSFFFNIGYLLAAYIFTSTDGYDLIWTTPHCILTLRMIGTAFDLYDGHREEAVLSQEQKVLNIKKCPSLLELCGYTYFPAAFLAGPQFSIRRYLDYTCEKLLDNDKHELPQCIMPAFNRLGVGAAYAVLQIVFTPMFPSEYLVSEEFASSSFFYQIFIVTFWSKVLLFKYCTVFLLVEGACIMSGIAYNGRDKDGKVLWDACASIKPLMLETATYTGHYIKAFNISTNTWVARYVFKRLKFLNNRYISQGVSVLFLAMWHGMYIGYYICFALEIFVTATEAFVQDAIRRSPPLARIVNNPIMKFPLFALTKFTVVLSIGYPLVSFVLLRWRKIRLVYLSMWHIPTIVLVGFPLLYQFVILPRLKKWERSSKKPENLDKVEKKEESAKSE